MELTVWMAFVCSSEWICCCCCDVIRVWSLPSFFLSNISLISLPFINHINVWRCVVYSAATAVFVQHHTINSPRDDWVKTQQKYWLTVVCVCCVCFVIWARRTLDRDAHGPGVYEHTFLLPAFLRTTFPTHRAFNRLCVRSSIHHIFAHAPLRLFDYWNKKKLVREPHAGSSAYHTTTTICIVNSGRWLSGLGRSVFFIYFRWIFI